MSTSSDASLRMAVIRNVDVSDGFVGHHHHGWSSSSLLFVMIVVMERRRAPAFQPQARVPGELAGLFSLHDYQHPSEY
uniref:Uncharacterized protein n=1 Tax=Panagrellus redivivus TaxID=6233 RepID=A0A7E4ZQH3_PANRE